EVLFCRHYELVMCTDETSAHMTVTACACWALCGEDWPVVATFVRSRLTAAVPQQGRSRQGFPQGKTGSGLAATTPPFVLLQYPARTMKYRCVASSPEGLVQQVAVCYLRHGYWWYVTG